MYSKKELGANPQAAATSSSVAFFSKSPWPQKLIDAGCTHALLKSLSDVEKECVLEIDYKSLYSNFMKIREERRESGVIHLRAHANNVWKLLCLTGQLAYIPHAIRLMKEDTELQVNGITPEQQQDYNCIEAMNYAAYTGNLEGLELLYAELRNKTLFNHPKISSLILINAVYSDELKTLDWVISTLNIELSALNRMKKNVLLLAAEVGNVEMMAYAVAKCKANKTCVFNGLNSAQVATLYGKLDAVKYALEKLGFDKKLLSNGRTLLHIAFEGGDLDTIKYLISLGLDFRKTTEDTGDNILHLAAMNGYEQAMRYAVELGINPNSQNNKGATALHYAANAGSLPSVKCALELGCQLDIDLHEGLKVINFAACSGDLETFKYIVSRMDAIEVRRLLHDQPRIVKDILQNNMGVDGIKFAVSCGLDLFMPVDRYQSNLLLIAASHNNSNNIAVFNYLLEAGIKPRANLGNITILHMAALSGSPELLRLAHQTLLLQDPEHNPLAQAGDFALTCQYALKSKAPDRVIPVIQELRALALGQQPTDEPLKVAYII